MLVRPYIMRKKYLKYPNVALSKDFHPVLGEIKICMDNMADGRFIFSHYEETASDSSKDMMLIFSGDQPQFQLFSPKAHHEFLKLSPSKIDRNDCFKDTMLKIANGALDQMRTTEKQKMIKKEFMLALGQNKLSQKLPEILEIIEKHVSSWPLDTEIDITQHLSSITFEIICHALFGKTSSHFPTCKYFQHNSHNKTPFDLPFSECFQKVLKDTVDHYFTATAKLFPFLSKYNLIQPFINDKANIDQIDQVLMRVIRGEFKEEGDSDCAFMTVKKKLNLSDKELLVNLKVFFVGGMETLSKLLTSCLFYLKKYPKVAQALDQEITSLSESPQGNISEKREINKENLEQMDQVSSFMREVLRIDSPLVESLPYKAFQDVEICGVPIPKGSYIALNIVGRHMNPNEWKDPSTLEPLRFDPESEYFNKPGEEKPRDRVSYSPFSIGERKCPGQALALFEGKVLLVYLLTHIKYSVSDSFTSNPNLKFSSGSHFKLPLKITQKS